MDLILRNSRVLDRDADALFDIGVDKGRIVAIEPALAAEGEEIDLGGRMVTPGFVETHIHLDKSCIIERCGSEEGRQAMAVKRVAAAKPEFTVEDVRERARRTLEKCILNGATHMRTHVEVDPGVGSRGMEGVFSLVEDYKWAIDIEICVFPQEGLACNPGTEELMVASLKSGAATVVGAAPGYEEGDHNVQIDRVFELAREFDVDIDMHLDFGNTPDDMDILHVCDLTEKYGYGGRVAVGHMTKLSVAPPEQLAPIVKRLADVGVTVTVLPATDLFLMGRHQEHSVLRGVVAAHELVHAGVNCTLSTNNVLNPFTPFGDGSLIRMANLYANVCQVNNPGDMRACFDMFTQRSANLLGLDDYGVVVGNSADLVVLNCDRPEAAIAENIAPIYGFKRGRRTFTRQPAELHRPNGA